MCLTGPHYVTVCFTLTVHVVIGVALLNIWTYTTWQYSARGNAPIAMAVLLTLSVHLRIAGTHAGVLWVGSEFVVSVKVVITSWDLLTCFVIGIS